jgi:hypothetical protein
MSYNAYVCRIKNLRKHNNADKLMLGECFGNTVCVDTSYEVDELGIYFPTDGQVSPEFAECNNLLRKKDENGKSIGGYMDPMKRNITTIRLRGEKSDGLFLHLNCVSYTGALLNELTEGFAFTTLNGHEICKKYIPARQNRQGNVNEGNHVRKKKAPIAPLFIEHADTEQLAYNLNAFKPNDLVEITLKMHGTSQRTGYLPMLKGYKRTLLDRIMRRDGTPIYEYGYVSGTRRTVLNDWEGGFYGSNMFRKKHADFFEGKLHKGEEVYYEVVGFTDEGMPIMSSASNRKLNDKDFLKKYGETTTFSYGCSCTGYYTYGDGSYDVLPKSDFYVYRMTITNEDGDVVEYTPDFMRYRCEQMGCKCVPVLWRGFLDDTTDWNDAGMTAGEQVKEIAERYYDGPDPIGKTHVREGVVIRILNRPKFCAYKHKNFAFKCLEGLVKAEETAPDMEEAEEVQNDET